jgi:hypothetical protein
MFGHRHLILVGSGFGRRFCSTTRVLQLSPGALPAVPHERWAELAKRMHDTEQAGDDTTEDAH